MAGLPPADQAVPVPSFDKDRIARIFRRILMTMDRSLEGIAGLPEAQRGQGSAKVSGLVPSIFSTPKVGAIAGLALVPVIPSIPCFDAIMAQYPAIP